MNKSFLSTIALILYCVDTYSCQSIPIAIERHHHNLDVQRVNIESQPHSSHVFEIEPISAPLRLVFSSHSSPLYLDVEKAFKTDSAAKTDRKGTVGSDASAEAINTDNTGGYASSGGGGVGADTYNDDEYTVIDQYERYVPVKVLNGREGLSATEPRVFIEPKGAKLTTNANQESKQEIKKVKLVSKAQKLTTVPIKVVESTDAGAQASTVSNKAAKFGARISRHTDNEQKQQKSNKKQKSNNDKQKSQQ